MITMDWQITKAGFQKRTETAGNCLVNVTLRLTAGYLSERLKSDSRNCLPSEWQKSVTYLPARRR